MIWKKERLELLNPIPVKNTNLKKKQALLNRLKNIRNENVKKLRLDLKSEDMTKFNQEIVHILDKTLIKSDEDVRNVVRLSIPELIDKIENDVNNDWRFILLYELKILYSIERNRTEHVVNSLDFSVNSAITNQMTSFFYNLPIKDKLNVLLYFLRNEEPMNSSWPENIKNGKIDMPLIELYNEVARKLEMVELKDESSFIKIIEEEENEFLFYEIPFPSTCMEKCIPTSAQLEKAITICKTSSNLLNPYKLAKECDLIINNNPLIDLDDFYLPCAGRIIFYSRRRIPSNYLLRAELTKFTMDLSQLDSNNLVESVEIIGRYHLTKKSTNKKIRELMDKIKMKRVNADITERMKIDSCLATIMKKNRVSVDFKRIFVDLFDNSPPLSDENYVYSGYHHIDEKNHKRHSNKAYVLDYLGRNKGFLILLFLKTWLFSNTMRAKEWVLYFDLQDAMLEILFKHVLATKDISLTHLLSTLVNKKEDFYFNKLKELGSNVLLAYCEHLPMEKKVAYVKHIENSTEMKNFCWRNRIDLSEID